MWYDMALAVDPHNPDAIFLDAIDIWKSTDGGKTLTDISCGYHTGVTPVASPVHVDNHTLAYQPGSSTNLLAGSDGGIYVSNNAANAPQGTAAGVNNPPTFKDVNLTMNTIEFYGGDISSNFATAASPFVVGGAQDNGSSYYQFAGGSTLPRGRVPVVAADRRRRLLRAHRAQAGAAGVHGEPERQSGALDDRPAGPYTSAAGPWGGDRLSFIFPYKIDKFACPTTTCDHMIAGADRVWESIDGAEQLVPEQPRPDEGHPRRPLVHQPARLRADDERERDRRHERRQRPVRLRPGHGHGEHGDVGERHRRQQGAAQPADPGRRDQPAERARRLRGGRRLRREHEEHPRSRVPAHVHDLLHHVHVGEQVGEPAQHPGQRGRGEPERAEAGLRRHRLGPLLHERHHRHDADLAPLPGRPAEHDDLELLGRPRRHHARRVHALARRVGDPAPDPVGHAGDPLLGRLRVEQGLDALVEQPATGRRRRDANSPSTAWTSAPYTDTCDINLDSPSITVPSGANTIRLSFFEKHDTEDYGPGNIAARLPCDYGQVQLSTDGGSTYTSVGGLYFGAQPAYASSTVPLPDSAAGKTIRIRFHFHSDANTSVPQGGWWVDDPKITAEPQSAGKGASVAR